MKADEDNDDFLDTANLLTKTMKADEDNDAGGASLAYAWADDHLPLVVTDMSGDISFQIKLIIGNQANRFQLMKYPLR